MQLKLQAEAPFTVRRLGLLMEADCSDPHEVWGVLNPGCVRGPDGELYLFPRLVASNNYSRIGIARVKFDATGEPCGVERLGVALEPTQLYEQNQITAGCEDARVTYVDYLKRYIMTYTAYGPLGPRIALAVSQDLLHWERLGSAIFAYRDEWEMDFNLYPNKDAVLFPEPVLDPLGRPALALLHSPNYDLTAYLNPGLSPYVVLPHGIEDARTGIWISYCPIEILIDRKAENLIMFDEHQLLMTPNSSWQRLKVGAGTAPLKTPYGWFLIFHGASGHLTNNQPKIVHYSAGALLLDLQDPRKILYRSSRPILEPELPEEQHGIMPGVVFPTGCDLRQGNRIDIYYGMADERIGAATLQLPDHFPAPDEFDQETRQN
jgi:predicted GH43/DUF377 family glycosyl hydrolase